MKPQVWRTLAICFIALAIAFALYQLTLPQRDSFGYASFSPLNRPQVVVSEVDPGSPAARAGIRKGDVITFGHGRHDRINALFPTPGTHVRLIVNGSRIVMLTARKLPALGSALAVPTLIRLAFLLVAALLAWRKADDRVVRALVVFLFCYGLGIGLDNGVLETPMLTFIVLQLGLPLTFLSGTAAATTFAANFPSPSSAIANILARISKAIAIAGIVLVCLVDLAPAIVPLWLANAIIMSAFASLGILVVATLVVAYVWGAPSERQRRRWVFLIVGFGMTGLVVDIVVSGVIGYQPWLDTLALVPIGAIPIGLAYVILRHRVIDVGFVLNRALVYTGVSAIIVAIFVIVESLLSKYVEQNSRVGSIAAQLIVALILGFSIRAIHSRVDRFVDNVLFRERHLAEAALRLLAHDAAYITDAQVLLSRCVRAVERYARARGGGVWVANSPSFRPAASTFEHSVTVDENDAAVVAMRARRVSVDLPLEDSSLPGALAFPMIVRGELLGMLVCGRKADDEEYAPDERDALASLAASVGHALDTIEVRELRSRLEVLAAAGPPSVATDEGRAAF